MIPLHLLFIMLFIHWIADFVLQTHKEATNKSSSMYYLTSHTINYSMCWLAPIWLISNFGSACVFVLITFFIHTIQDYFTSRWVKKYFDKKDFHNGFVVIGLDQILHYTQLVLTYLLYSEKGLTIA